MSDWFDKLKTDDIVDETSVVGDLRPETSIDDWWEDSKRFPYILVCNSLVKYDCRHSSTVIEPVSKAKKTIQKILENSGFKTGSIQTSYYELGHDFSKWAREFKESYIFDEYDYQKNRALKNFNGRGFFTEGSRPRNRIFFKIPFWEPTTIRQFLRALSSVYHYLNTQLMFNCSLYNPNSTSEYPNFFIYAYERKDSSELTAHPEMITNVPIDLLDCMYNKKEFRIPQAVTRTDFLHTMYLIKMFRFNYKNKSLKKYKKQLFDDFNQIYQIEKDRSLGFKSSPIETIKI